MTISDIRHAVNELCAARLNCYPPARDGSKRPAGGAWKHWQTKRVPAEQLDAWYGDAPGVGIFCGAISGNVECLEFDDWQTWEAYRDTAEATGLDTMATVAAGWSDATPGGGVHLYYRCDDIGGNTKLASRPGTGGNVETLIETRGEGGYVIVAPSGGPTHPSGNPYTRLAGGPATIATVTPDTRAAMFDLARAFDETPPKRGQTFTAPQGKAGNGSRPGDELNASADEAWWRERTEADGWTWTAGPGGMSLLARPGNPAGWTGATWNWGGRSHLRVFTTSTPLAPGMYDAFGYVAYWDHGGDWKAAAKALAAAGYGQRAAPFTFPGEDAGNAGGDGDDASDPDAMRLAPNLAFAKGQYWSAKQTPDGMEWAPLCNFDARILEYRIISDGQTTRREYTIAGDAAGVPFAPVTIPASDFRGLDWLSEIGPHAIVTAGASVPGKLRQAIQERSVRLGIAETRVLAHSGWIEHAGQHVYLSTSGGIGPAGLRDDLTVEMLGKLAHLDLPAPDRARLTADVAAWLALWQLAPERIMAPLLASVPRAVLAPFVTIESSIQLEGRTGTRKSELTARVQQFFGPRFDRLTLPQTWGSTKNSIMLTAHQAKDAVCVVDDHVVDGSRTEQERQRATMNAVFSAVGNHADRGRLDGNMQQRAEYVPRGLILSSGEDQSYRQSATARTLLIEVRAGDARLDMLTAAQAAGEDGAFARLTAGFIQTVAKNWDATGRGYRERFRQYQARYRDTLNAHARTPDSAASLMAALECWLDFLEHAGGITQAMKADLLRRAGRGFLELGMAQAAALQSVDPVNQFVELVRSAIASGAAHVADAKDGGVPPDPKPCGYRMKLIRTGETLEPDYQPQGACIAWIDERGIFLEPNAALSVAQSIGAKTGQSIPWQSKTLGKRLAERGMLASSEAGRNYIRLNLAGARRAVWHLTRETILPPESDDPDNVRAFAGGNGQEVA